MNNLSIYNDSTVIVLISSFSDTREYGPASLARGLAAHNSTAAEKTILGENAASPLLCG